MKLDFFFLTQYIVWKTLEKFIHIEVLTSL